MTNRIRRSLLGLATGLVVAVVLIGLRGTYLLESAELKTLDARFRALRDPAGADTSIVIVDVDNLSLDLARQTLGWPWPRDAWAVITDYLAAGGARAIVFDFTYPEPNLLNPAGDSAFASAAERAGIVVQALTFQRVTDTAEVRRLARFREDSASIRLLLDVYDRSVDSLPRDLGSFQAVQHPYPALLRSAQNLGAINFTPDPVDGTTRRSPLLYRFRDSTFLALGLAAALTADSMRFLGCPRWSWRRDGLALCDDVTPVDRNGAMLINWHGPYRDPDSRRETYRVFPAAQIFQSYAQARAGEAAEVPLETFRGKLVFVGASGSGLFEARANPFAPSDPGVLIHATLADNILNRDYLYRASTVANLAALLVAAVLAGLAVSTVTAVWASAALGAGLMALSLGVAAWLFAAQSLWLDAAAPALAVLLTFTGGMAVNYFTEGRHKKQIRDMFSKYVAPEYVAQLAEDPSKLHLEGRRAELSILFSDIRGFTSISEKMQPTEVIGFLNEYLSEMAAIVKASGGTLDKFIGDAVMAFWGEPIPRADHADRACDCALAMRDATRKIAERFAREGKPPIRIGIGINTADVVVGNIGSLDHKLDYTVIGDGVNLASRLEGLNKEFATTIIISEFTRAKLGDRYDTRPLGDVKVKGKDTAIGIHELLGKRVTA